MDTGGTVLDDGIVYVSGLLITAVQPATAPAPAGFETVVPVATGPASTRG